MEVASAMLPIMVKHGTPLVPKQLTMDNDMFMVNDIALASFKVWTGFDENKKRKSKRILIRVKVLDKKLAWGRRRYLVAPTEGEGNYWTESLTKIE